MNLSQMLADFAGKLTYDSIPDHINWNVNFRILDLVSSAAAGHRVNREMNDVVFRVLRQQSAQGQSSLFFREEKLSASQAAFYNAFVDNGADMDDGHMLANGHPGVTVIPPVLALGEWRPLPYRDMATAIVAGYEVYIRLSRAVMPSHLRRGFNGTGTVGSIAAAAAAAKALGLGAGGIHVAMGLAATSASGLMELNESGQAMKPINPGNAAYRGVLCALMAEAGAVGPEAPLDGTKGFFGAFADETDTGAITQGLGAEFQMDAAYIKLYPACRHMHAMIDCAALIREREHIALSDIRELTLYTYPASDELTGLIKHPKSGAEAKFSLTYATAVALATGGYSLDDLTGEAEQEEEIRTLIDKMKIVVDPTLEDRSVMLRGAQLEVTRKDGETFSASVEVPKGEKRFPVETADVRRKLDACAGELLSDEQRDKVFEASVRFDQITDLREYFLMLAKKE